MEWNESALTNLQIKPQEVSYVISTAQQAGAELEDTLLHTRLLTGFGVIYNDAPRTLASSLSNLPRSDRGTN